MRSICDRLTAALLVAAMGSLGHAPVQALPLIDLASANTTHAMGFAVEPSTRQSEGPDAGSAAREPDSLFAESGSRGPEQPPSSRSALAAQLRHLGVAADDAAKRVAAMQDHEVTQALDQAEHAPAGGDAVGVLFTVFIILLITDILGLTKVFPFTRSINR